MKRAGQCLLGQCFVLLFCLCAATLVEGPETDLPPKKPVPVPCHAVWAEATVPDPDDAPLRQNGDGERVHMVRAGSDPAPVTKVPVRESNGVPLTGKSWVRTVYNACPPEDEVG